MKQRADHWLHVEMHDDWASFSLSCMDGTDPEAHVCLTERECTCECEMCTGTDEMDPDHWGCDRQEHGYSLDGAPPCETEVDTSTCWTKHLMENPSESLHGEFPRDGAPWPVFVQYLGDGEVEIWHAPIESGATHSDGCAS